MHTLTAGEATAVIDPDDGCRLTSLSFADGLDVIGRDEEQPLASPFHHGAFPMAPFAGRIRHGRFTFEGRTYQVPVNFEDHAIHGTVCDRPWVPTRAGDAEWTCDLGDRWPFPGRVVQRASLTPARFRFELEVHADAPMPATIGWHPWFCRTIGGTSAVVRFDAGLQYRKDEEGIPTGERVAPWGNEPLDDCFTDVDWFSSPPSVTWPGVGTVEVVSDATHLVVYTAPPSAVCVEPQTGPPDAPDLGEAAIVTAALPLTAWMELRWRPAPSGTDGSGRAGGRSRTG